MILALNIHPLKESFEHAVFEVSAQLAGGPEFLFNEAPFEAADDFLNRFRLF